MMLTHVKNLRRRVAGSLVATVTLALAVPLLQSGPALADTAPVPPVTQTTVSADALPTVQIDGVAWAQVVVGNRVYLGTVVLAEHHDTAGPAHPSGGRRCFRRRARSRPPTWH